MAEYDDIIVGGGSAGIALATRLTEDESRQVLLIEAGPDHPGVADADRLGDQMQFASTLTEWGIDATFGPGTGMNYPQGRKMGGGSAVNGAFAVRGLRDDYERWAAAAGDEWSWPHMLRVLCRLESRPGLRRRVPRHDRAGSRRALAPRRAPAGPAGVPHRGHGPRHPLGRRPQRARHVGDRADADEPARRRPHVDRVELPAARPGAAEPDDLARHRGARASCSSTAGPSASSTRRDGRLEQVRGRARHRLLPARCSHRRCSCGRASARPATSPTSASTASSSSRVSART